MRPPVGSPDRGGAPGVDCAYLGAIVGADRVTPLLAAVDERVDDGRVRYLGLWKATRANIAALLDEAHGLSRDRVPPGNFECLMAAMVQGRSPAEGFPYPRSAINES